MQRRALLIATSRYNASEFSRLPSTQIDARNLSRVLADPSIGNFHVTKRLNRRCQPVRKRLERFFSSAKHDELLLLYISSHAVKDIDGHLYFAVGDTCPRHLLSTSIPASYIHALCLATSARAIVMIFDSCFSGAFVKGFEFKSGMAPVNAADYFQDSKGTIIITASDSIEYALAGPSSGYRAVPSLFSGLVIEGLKTGAADRDRDGRITSEELFTYVTDAMRARAAPQRPHRWVFGATSDITIASNCALSPLAASKPAAQPSEIRTSARGSVLAYIATAMAATAIGTGILAMTSHPIEMKSDPPPQSSCDQQAGINLCVTRSTVDRIGAFYTAELTVEANCIGSAQSLCSVLLPMEGGVHLQINGVSSWHRENGWVLKSALGIKPCMSSSEQACAEDKHAFESVAKGSVITLSFERSIDPVMSDVLAHTPTATVSMRVYVNDGREVQVRQFHFPKLSLTAINQVS